MRIVYLHIFIFLLACGTCVQAQSQNWLEGESAIFGDVNPDLIRLEAEGIYENEDAIILNDIGEASFLMINTKRLIRYRYHRRIKFFSDDEKDAAEVRIPFDQSVFNLTRVKAITYNLNAYDEPTAFEIGKRNIDIVKTGKHQREIRFRFPVVKKGSVAEYFVEFTTTRLNILEPWTFQQTLPVVMSEFHLLVPGNYRYTAIRKGDTRNMLTLNKPFAYNAPSRLERSMFGAIGPSADQGDSWNDLGGEHYIFLMERVPPVRKEAFGGGGDRLLAGLEFQLTSSPDNSSGSGIFSKWEQLERYVKRKTKPRRIKADEAWMASQVKRLTRGMSDKHDKAKVIYSWSRQNLPWDSTYSIWPTRLDQVRSKGGNSSALNLSLLYMLREAGLDAHPVLISTRSNGPIQVQAPNLAQFNHLIVGLKIGAEEILLDALSDLDDLGVLPKEDLNQMGYWIAEEEARWVRLTSRNQIVRFTYSRFTLNEEGWLTGDISTTNRNFSAALERKRLMDLDKGEEESYLRQNFLTGMGDPRIRDFQIEPEADQGKSVIYSLDLQTQDFVQQAGELMFVKPMMTKMMEENPFPDEERATPIDLNYPLRESHLLGLRIPPGYEIEQLPEPIRVRLPGNAGSFIYNVLHIDDIIHVSSTIYLNQTVFLPSEYLGIKSFFDYVVLKHNEDIVLKKVSAE